jgi:hypothetical protein
MGLFGMLGGLLGGNEIGGAIAEQQSYVMDPWNDAWEDLFGEEGMQAQTLADYQSQYQEMIDLFDTGAAGAEEQLALRQAEEMGYLGTGREATLEQVSRGFEQARGQTMAQNIMGGLANTSWGQQSLGAVDVEAGLAAANVETAYADRFASTTARQGQEMAQMQQWRIGGGTAIRGSFAEGLAGLRGEWAGRRQSMEEYGAGLRGGWAERNIEHSERNVGVGLNMFGSFLGGLGF